MIGGSVPSNYSQSPVPEDKQDFIGFDADTFHNSIYDNAIRKSSLVIAS